MSKSYGWRERDDEEHDERRREYEADVHYDAWRRGVPEGRIRDEAIDDAYYDGRSPESIVSDEIQMAEDRRYQRMMDEAEEQRAFDEMIREAGI